MTTILRHALTPTAAALLQELGAEASTHPGPVDVSGDAPDTIAELIDLGFLARAGASTVEVLRV